MLGWHVRSRLPPLWCSQIVAPYVCWQACVQSRPLALWYSQIVVLYMCAVQATGAVRFVAGAITPVHHTLIVQS